MGTFQGNAAHSNLIGLWIESYDPFESGGDPNDPLTKRTVAKFEDYESYSNSIAGADGGGGESKLKNGGEGVADPAPRYVRAG